MAESNSKNFDFMGLLGRLADLLVIGIVFSITCLPVITIGPSITALYHTVVKVIRRERGKLLKVYFTSFRSNFRQGFLLGLICFVYLLIGLADIYLLQVYGHMFNAVKFFFVVTWLYMLPLAFGFPWLFSYLSRFQDPVGRVVKNALILSISNIGATLRSLLAIAAGVALCFVVPAIIPVIPGPICLLVSRQTEPVFKQLTRERPIERGVDAWYNE